MHSSLFADLAYDAQRTIAANADTHRQTQEAILANGRTGLRKRMGSALITLGEHVSGIHRDAISTIATDSIGNTQGTMRTYRAC